VVDVNDMVATTSYCRDGAAAHHGRHPLAGSARVPVRGRIHIVGASGSGTTSLAAAIAARHGHRHLDTDDFYWLPTDPPYRENRPREARFALLRDALAESPALGAVGISLRWGDPLIPEFELVVFLVSRRTFGSRGCARARSRATAPTRSPPAARVTRRTSSSSIGARLRCRQPADEEPGAARSVAGGLARPRVTAGGRSLVGEQLKRVELHRVR